MNIKDIIRICDRCGLKSEPFRNNILKGIGGSRSHKACDNCKEEYFKEIKDHYVVDDYKGNVIYEYNGGFFPYWEARYFFLTLEDCKNRIDNSHISIMC